MLVALVGFQAVMITVVALIFGLRVPPANFLLALIVLAMMVLLGVSISYALAILVPNESVLPSVINGVAQPLSLLAGVLIPLSVAPLWVRNVALWNPLAWAANGMRAIFAGHIGAQVVWQASIILAGLAVVAVVLSVTAVQPRDRMTAHPRAGHRAGGRAISPIAWTSRPF